MQVLIECDESRKVILVEKISDIVQKAKECFQGRCCCAEEIKGGVVVQKYDKEWSEYIDCDSFVDIVAGDKPKIIVNQSKRSIEGQDKRLVSNLKLYGSRSIAISNFDKIVFFIFSMLIAIKLHICINLN